MMNSPRNEVLKDEDTLVIEIEEEGMLKEKINLATKEEDIGLKLYQGYLKDVTCMNMEEDVPKVLYVLEEYLSFVGASKHSKK